MVERLTFLLALTTSLVNLPAFADSWWVEGRDKNLETGEPTVNLVRRQTMPLAECKEWIASDPFGLGAGEVAIDGKSMYVVTFKDERVSMGCVANRATIAGEQKLILPLGLEIEE
jgi:hypothetical protein